MKSILLFLTVLILLCLEIQSSPTRDRSVVIKVTALQAEKPSIRLDWLADSNTFNYIIRKKLKEDESWTVLDTLQPWNISYIDSNITIGKGYEYFIEKWTNDYDGYGYVYAGINLPLTEYNGKVLILIDSTIAAPLAMEIARFIQDLEGEGWTVVTKLAPRAEKYNSKAVQLTKNIVLEEFRKDSLKLKSLILLGRIAVPYSGAYALDGHSYDHRGAWPADVYYSVIDGDWTDNEVNIDSMKRNENENIPGDGKFDQVTIPGESRLQSGRIDMYNLPEFELSETELLRRYLDKNHNYRNKVFTVRQRGLIDDGFGMYTAEAMAAAAWISFTSVLGLDSVEEGSFRYTLPEKDYLWAYGNNSGSYTSIHNTAYTNELDSLPYRGVFTVLFGSYNGDFDSENNLLRSTLASNPSILTCTWSGRPFWFFHHMSLGEPIGYSAKLTQNNKTLYLSSGVYGFKGPHISLLGDPTLRMHIVSPPQNLKIEGFIEKNYARRSVLKWNHSKDEILGYNIYRAEYPNQLYTRINNEPVTDSVFTDENPFLLSNYYKVRAVRLEKAATGTYYNMSGSAFGSINFNNDTNNIFCRILPNPVTNIVYIYLDLPETNNVTADIYNSNGAFVRTVNYGEIGAGVTRLDWNLTDRFGAVVSSGVYFMRLKIGKYSKTEKLVIIR